jgi:hypothetical protein
MDLSPLQDYCQKIDLQHYDKTYGWYYYDLALKLPSEFVTNLLLKEFEWRANHQQNILASVEGEQGSGKSLFTINMAIWTGKHFGNQFNLGRDIYTNPYELDSDIRNNDERRRTFLYDEQPQRMVGLGSYSTKISLRDYEEIGRYTQKNVFYCSPQLHDHAHYFVFKQVDYQLDRIVNPTCKVCPKYIDCVKHKYSTLCLIPFFERDGYPKQFRFMLYTKRLSDQVLMPRGIVAFPMLMPKTAIEYDRIKDKNIKAFENYENKAWENKVNDIKEFVNEFQEELIKETTLGKKPVSKKLIEATFYNKFGTNRFLKEEVGLFVEMARQMLQKRCGGE